MIHRMENIPDIKSISDLESNTIKKDKFRDIQCPLSRNALIVRNCYSCKYCQKIKAKHQTNRTLTALICLFGLDLEDENK
ncbi:MAG: hypothetical protein JXA54_03615 [Candidatus Heimdallarchaeota archaeon]|nr:hypothetical protein [Candidatus Heimdallarchaeota archaeon]